VDCDTGLPLYPDSNPLINCPERRFEPIYGKLCDYRVKTLKFRAVRIQHSYDGAGFSSGTGLSKAFGLNDNSDIVGQARTSGGELHAVRLNIGPYYFENHYFSDLGTPRLTSEARAISNEQTIVGASQYAIGSSMVDAIWHSQLGGFRVLNALGGHRGAATGLARNSSYTEFVSGFGIWASAQGGDNKEHGFVWSFDGLRTKVDAIGVHGQVNRAFGINDSKIAVGYVLRSGVKNAYLWSYGTLSYLADYGNFESVALDVNNNTRQKIVGYAKDSNDKKHALLWNNGVFTPLPHLSGRSNSVANAISDGSDIVGWSGWRATFWRDGKAFDLNSLLDQPLNTVLTTALDINRHGRILTKANDGYFYLLVPTESF